MFEQLFGLAKGDTKRRTAIKRSIRSPMMNLAFGLTPVAGAGWDTAPTVLKNLTDESKLTECVAGNDNDATSYIEIDLGQEFEIYQIVIANVSGSGFKSTDVTSETSLITLDGAANATTRDTQVLTAGAAYVDSTLGFDGEGIPVQKVRISMGHEAGATRTLKLSEIEIFGC